MTMWNGQAVARSRAINCKDRTLGWPPTDTRSVECKSSPVLGSPDAVRNLINQSLTDSTKRAYRADLAHYESTGRIVPSTPYLVAEYLAESAGIHAAATIQRRLVAISKAHLAMEAVDPTRHELVRATMRGIRRSVGTAQRQAKPIVRDDLFSILERMGDRPLDRRDKALLLVGFAGAFRRSELVGLVVADIEHVRQGMVVTLRRSKTDQEGQGRKIGIPFGRTRWCPVRHLTDWLSHAVIENGPIFRGINRHGHVADQSLSGEAVSIVVKGRAEAAGFDPALYSGHSLRAGFATSAAIAGASTFKIRAQTGHASDAMLARYIRDGDMFTNNAVSTVL
ncbi:site-specific integrase [Mesorhizobium sp. KR9-304]|uniref:site-specific integrase n=1 Tax=Mesorhizobium sp. KR9-304 TaxID=3156614 RepID=UPI0032B3413D